MVRRSDLLRWQSQYGLGEDVYPSQTLGTGVETGTTPAGPQPVAPTGGGAQSNNYPPEVIAALNRIALVNTVSTRVNLGLATSSQYLDYSALTIGDPPSGYTPTTIDKNSDPGHKLAMALASVPAGAAPLVIYIGLTPSRSRTYLIVHSPDRAVRYDPVWWRRTTQGNGVWREV